MADYLVEKRVGLKAETLVLIKVDLKAVK